MACWFCLILSTIIHLDSFVDSGAILIVCLLTYLLTFLLIYFLNIRPIPFRPDIIRGDQTCRGINTAPANPEMQWAHNVRTKCAAFKISTQSNFRFES